MQKSRSIFNNLNKKGKQFLKYSIVFSAFFSCSKKDFQDDLQTDKNVSPEAAASITLNPNLLYQEDFEGSTPLSTYVGKQVGTSYGLTYGLFNGQKSARFELRDTDPIQSGGTRTEIKFPRPTENNPERWYAWSVYFPSADYKIDNSSEIITQFHQGSGASPSIAVTIKADRLLMDIRAVEGAKGKIDIAPVTKDKWQNFVFHIIHSHGSDGLVQVWQDGKKIMDLKGPNSYDFSKYELPEWKMGLYKWDWNGSATTSTTKRVIYFDNIRFGTAKATYNDMAATPAQIAPLPVDPTPVVITPVNNPNPIDITPTELIPADPLSTLSINNFTLVNAGNEKDIVTITNGATFSIQELGTSKLNIRANLGSATGSVKFDLTGPQTFSSIDNAAPYALMGDDGNGNYYYGIWKYPAPGSYTLTATPYTSIKARGTAGTSSTIRFTITD